MSTWALSARREGELMADGRMHPGPNDWTRRSWRVDRCRARMAELGVDAASVAGLLVAAATAVVGAERAWELVRELSRRDYQLPAEVRAQLVWQASRRELPEHEDEKRRPRARHQTDQGRPGSET